MLAFCSLLLALSTPATAAPEAHSPKLKWAKRDLLSVRISRVATPVAIVAPALLIAGSELYFVSEWDSPEERLGSTMQAGGTVMSIAAPIGLVGGSLASAYSLRRQGLEPQMWRGWAAAGLFIASPLVLETGVAARVVSFSILYALGTGAAVAQLSVNRSARQESGWLSVSLTPMRTRDGATGLALSGRL